MPKSNKPSDIDYKSLSIDCLVSLSEGCNKSNQDGKKTVSIDGKEYIKPIEIALLAEGEIKRRENISNIPDEKIKSEMNQWKEPFLYLGFDEKAYYFIPQNQNIPIRINRGNTSLKNNLEEIARVDWWLAKFGKENKSNENIIDYDAALDYLRRESYKRGIYDDASLLGVGPHRDKDGIIINTGRALQIYGNGIIDYNDYTGDLAFVRSHHKFEIKGESWNWSERKQMVEQVNTFGFETSLQKACLIGWCVTAPFASLFEFRPHIWITARKGTGKSFLMDNIIEPAIGPFLTKIEGKTSEAGIRQTIKRDSRPVLIDEFEANNKHEQMSITSILGLARSAYGGGEIVKGSPSHEAIIFKTKMTFCFSSVKTYFTNSADESRVVVINMKESVGKMTGAPNFEGLRKMIFDRLYDLLENIKLAKTEILKRGNNERTGDTYSPLLAGYWMVASDDLFMQADDDKNNKMGMLIDLIGNEYKSEDEDNVIDYILAAQIRIDNSDTKTIAEMLTEYSEAQTTTEKQLKYDGNLRRIGIRRMIKSAGGKDREILAISANHQEIRKILNDTAHFEYKEVISRHKSFIPGDKHKFPTVFMAGKNDRVIMLDWEMIQSQFLSVPEGDDGIPF